MIDAPKPSSSGGRIVRIGHSEALSARLEVGASLAVSGVCLTLIEHAAGRSTVELSPETLRRTTLGALGAGSEVNLEPALRLGDPLGGHWVQGHVDGVLEVLERRDLEAEATAEAEGDDARGHRDRGHHDRGHRELAFSLPKELAPLVVEKGSVTLDGVSLTVSSLAADRFEVALIPHTLEWTTLELLVPGDRVNYEADVLAKYVQRAVAPHVGAETR